MSRAGAGGRGRRTSGDQAGIAPFLFAFATILIAAKLGGEIFERFNQPAVLGELVFGVILGNLSLVGVHLFDGLRTMPDVHTAAEIGVILLLFEVGLESNLPGLLAVGLSATLVAVLGVIAPVILGYFVSMWFLPEAAWYVHLFAGATLAATSVGITARVLKDLRQDGNQGGPDHSRGGGRRRRPRADHPGRGQRHRRLDRPRRQRPRSR